MKKRNLSFAIAVAITASLNIPEDQYNAVLKDTREVVLKVQADDDGELWGLCLQGRANLTEQGYRLIESTLEETGGDVDATAELVFIRGVQTGMREAIKEDVTEDKGLSRVQVSFKMTPKSNTIINEQKKEA